MNKLGLIVISCFFLSSLVSAQYVALKNNALYDAIATPNLGLEVSLGKHFTVEVSGNYNPWKFSGNRSLKHTMVQPELRYWLLERFNGHFIGVHGLYMDYVFKKVNLPFGMDKEFAYDGDAWGGGISYGYQLYLSPRWNMEFTAGLGYCYFKYDKYNYEIPENSEYLGLFRTNYWGLTKVGISIIYLLK